MKSFLDFRTHWLTKEKEAELIRLSMEQTKELKDRSQESFLATFSATFSILLLAEYHDWLSQP